MEQAADSPWSPGSCRRAGRPPGPRMGGGLTPLPHRDMPPRGPPSPCPSKQQLTDSAVPSTSQSPVTVLGAGESTGM